MARHGGEISVRKPGSPSSGLIRADRNEQAALRNEAVRMRIAGHRLVEIAAVVQRDISTVSRWITTELNQRLEKSVEELRAVELERLDSYLVALEPGIEAGDPKAINAALRVSERRARLCGLDKPLQIESTVITVDMIDHEMRRLQLQLAEIEARNAAVPGVVLADEELPAITATDPDAVGWGDPWAVDGIDGER